MTHEFPELPKDELDSLLRAWHQESRERAAASRDEVLARIERDRVSAPSVAGRIGPRSAPGTSAAARLRAAAVLAVAVIAGIAVLMFPSRTASADHRIVQVPDGGRLVAVAPDGSLVGPCPLEHTSVDAQVSGFISRVTVTQKYRNTYSQKVEAVYTFPLSHRAAVDRMRMTVRLQGEERIVEGEVKERSLARQIYETARRDGFVASLLEQERPNIFTQSVANIEPGAEVLVEISYVETLAMRDGAFTFDFPMVVGPRYIPGRPEQGSTGGLPRGLIARQGIILVAPAQVQLTARADDDETRGSAHAPHAAQVLAAITRAIPIQPPDAAWRERGGSDFARIRAQFVVRYPDGSQEPGTLRADDTGEVAGRWFFCPPAPVETGSKEGTGFAQGTDQVPDAARITPMPVRPPERAGHDLSLRVSIDPGGPAVTNLRSDLHRVDVEESADGKAVVTLESGKTIPNRDFALSWTLAGGAMTEGVLTQHVADRDGYFLLYLVPPARVEAKTIRPRELIFVLDTSGSMRGFPVEKSKEVMNRMLGAMRPSDTFNLITFSGDHHVLWPAPRPATEENRKIARDFVESRQGQGGTEMMGAIEAALRPTATGDTGAPGAATGTWRPASAPESSPAPPAVAPVRIVTFFTDGYVGNDQAIVDAIRKYAGSTRVFSFGIGNSVNRWLLAEMASAGRGAVDFVLLPSDADEVVKLFTERVTTPVLTDISIAFDGVETAHVTPALDRIPDLYDREPLVIAGRYPTPGRGIVRIQGMTGAGAFERTLAVDFPAGAGNSTVASPIWARKQVDEILRPHLTALQENSVPAQIHDMVVRIAEQHRIMSPFTSFVAVEKTRVTLGGKPVLVPVPIELPQGVSWEGNFGSAGEALRRFIPPQPGRADEGRITLGFELRPVGTERLEAAQSAGVQGSGGVPMLGDIPVLDLVFATPELGEMRPESSVNGYVHLVSVDVGVHRIDAPVTIDALGALNFDQKAAVESKAEADAGDSAGEVTAGRAAGNAVAPAGNAVVPAATPAPPGGGGFGGGSGGSGGGGGSPIGSPSSKPTERLERSRSHSVGFGINRPPASPRPQAADPTSTLTGGAKSGSAYRYAAPSSGGPGAPTGAATGAVSMPGAVALPPPPPPPTPTTASPPAPAAREAPSRQSAATSAPKPAEQAPANERGADEKAVLKERVKQLPPADAREPTAAGSAPKPATKSLPAGGPPPALVGRDALRKSESETGTEERREGSPGDASKLGRILDERGVVDKEIRSEITDFYKAREAIRANRAEDATQDRARAPDKKDANVEAPADEAAALAPSELRVYELASFGFPASMSAEAEREAYEKVSALLIESIDPDSWVATGGDRGSAWHVPGGRIAIVHGTDVHARVQGLIDALATIRALPAMKVTSMALAGGRRPNVLIDVRALLPADPRMLDERVDEIIGSLIELVDPGSWTMQGGERTLRFFDGVLLTNAESDRADACVRLLETLRPIAASAAHAPATVTMSEVRGAPRPLFVFDARALTNRDDDGAPTVDEIVDLVTTFVEPDSWTQTGGERSLHWFVDALVCDQDSAVAHRMLALLDALRVQRAAGAPAPPIIVEPGDHPLAIYDVRQVFTQLQGKDSDDTDKIGDALGNLITTRVDPSEWQSTGGSWPLRLSSSGTVVARAPAATQAKLAELMKEIADEAQRRAGGATTGSTLTAALGDSARPQSFTAAELNRLSARLDERLLVLGLSAMALRDQEAARTAGIGRASPPSDAASAPAVSGAASSASTRGSKSETIEPTRPSTLDPATPIRVVARFRSADATLDAALAELGASVESRASTPGVMVLHVRADRMLALGALEGTVRVVPFDPPDSEEIPGTR